ncbi:K(+)-transporting ATPase subunit F [Paenibacillus anaericanus]|uniref:K(+)-transporting ATPase subunit F n=1 Tax=Paenibacillus anaericanus TaxID=170367 RepID=UPI0014775895
MILIISITFLLFLYLVYALIYPEKFLFHNNVTLNIVEVLGNISLIIGGSVIHGHFTNHSGNRNLAVTG